MDSIIKNGVTIIKMPPKEPRTNKKTGILGSSVADNGKIKVCIRHEGKKYHLGTYENANDADLIRKTAEEKKADGTFLEWYAETFVPKENKYSLQIHFKGKKYTVYEYPSIEEASIAKKEADVHILDGTFLEWLEQHRASMKV